jgi:enoyl-CoA hydratase/carnithine racemase
MSDAVLLEIDDGIALVTLNRPDRLNALNYDLIDRLMAALDRIETDADAHAVILTGAGERAFSAGADIHEFAGSVGCGRDTAVRDFVRRGQAMTARLEAFRKPVIAAVNGLAFGGVAITEAVHLPASECAICRRKSILACRRPSRTQRRRRGSPAQARARTAADGRSTPQRALRSGGRARCRAMTLPAARELAARIIRHSPLAVGGIITAVTRGLNMTIGEGLQLESEQFAALVPTRDLGEGINAWIERRPPAYTGR